MSEEKSSPMGRPRHEPTEQSRLQVILCTAFGNKADQTAQIIGISEPTLRLYYADELEYGRLRAGNAVRTNLWRLATKPDFKAVRAISLWLQLVEHVPLNRQPAEEERLGKKEALDRAAEKPTGGWEGLLN